MSEPDPVARHAAAETAQAGQRERVAALHRTLEEQVAALRSGEDWTRWLQAAARFHDYSFANVLLILAQRPDATAVAGYQRWRQFGRHVDKGERGLRILAPVLRRPPAEDAAPGERAAPLGSSTAASATASTTGDSSGSPTSDGSGSPSRIVGYRVTHVWDVSQTSGTPLPEPPSPQLLRGQAPPGLWDRLAELMRDAGFRLERGGCPGVNGYTDFASRLVRVRDDVDDAQAVKTLAHELGHVRLHAPSRPDPSALLQAGTTAACRGTAEVEAESFAFIVAASHGLPTGDYSFPYVATWAQQVRGTPPAQAVRATGARVISAAHETLVLLQPPQPAFTAPTAGLAARLDAGTRQTTHLRQQADALADATPRVDAGRMVLTAVHAAAHAFYRDRVEHSWVPAYLARRSLSAALRQPWRAGYAPAGWTALTDHLRAAGWDDATLEASGLSRRARTGRLIDHFRDRLVLPITDGNGDVVAFIGRARPSAGDDVPKYLNSPATQAYDKSRTLYGLPEALRSLDAGAVPVLVEGPLDAIAVTEATSAHCVGVASCGTTLTGAHVDLLVQHVDLAGRPLVVATDRDDAGRAAAVRAYDLLTPYAADVRRADLGDADDPADHAHRLGPAAATAAYTSRSRPLVETVLDARLDRWAGRLPWIEGQVGATRDVAPLLLPLHGDVRAGCLRQVAARLQLDVPTLERLLAEAPHSPPRAGAGGPSRATTSRTPMVPPVPTTPSASTSPTVRPSWPPDLGRRTFGPSSTAPPPPAPPHRGRAR